MPFSVPFLILLTLPVNILTLGLFTFVINALMLMIVSAVIPGFDVQGFWTAVFGALIISVGELASESLHRRTREGGTDVVHRSETEGEADGSERPDPGHAPVCWR